MKTNFMKALILGLAITTIISCKKDDPTPTYTIPTTYNFTNVNYSGQKTRIAMLDEIGSYMATGSTGAVLDAQKLKDMYANVNSRFTNDTLNTSGKQLKDKTYASIQAVIESYFDSIALCSQSVTAASNGVAGIATSSVDASRKYLLSANGVEYNQLVRKHLMGAAFYYQALETYLANLETDDNSTIVTDEGTEMEHHFDEAFGYFGVPIDFPTNLTGLKYWGSYSNQVNPALGMNATLMNAFLAARAAISNKDYTNRDVQVTLIRQNWEKLVAASAIHELNGAKEDIAAGDIAAKNHVVTEAIGFIMSLRYNSSKTITDAQINQALAYLGTNLYNTTEANIDDVIDLLSSVYGFDSIKDNI